MIDNENLKNDQRSNKTYSRTERSDLLENSSKIQDDLISEYSKQNRINDSVENNQNKLGEQMTKEILNELRKKFSQRGI